MDEMTMSLGGRASEYIVFNKISTGALSDLERVTKLAYSMVSIYGMNQKLGNLSYYTPENNYTFNKPYSEETAQLIDKEVQTMVQKAYQCAIKLLSEKRKELEIVAQALLKKEIIFQSDMERLIGKRPFKAPHKPKSPSKSRAKAKKSPTKTKARTKAKTSAAKGRTSKTNAAAKASASVATKTNP